MTRWLHLTIDEVLDNVLSDDEHDAFDPDEPIMPGSDDQFSDLELDSDDDIELGSVDTSSNGPVPSNCSHGSDTPICSLRSLVRNHDYTHQALNPTVRTLPSLPPLKIPMSVAVVHTLKMLDLN